jgi:molybdenum cofactor cytidylyltransferase
MLRGVILAAGASTRMGTPKAALTLFRPGDTFVSALVSRFVEAGLPDVVVITGAAEQPVRQALGRIRPPVRVVHNSRWQEGQLTSLLAGLAVPPGEVLEGVMMTLVDAPLVSVATLRLLLRTWRHTRAPIVRPARGATHGHPVIFDAAVFAELRMADPRVGAKSVVRTHAERIANVPVEDDGAFIDIDTPDDYQQALRELRD